MEVLTPRSEAGELLEVGLGTIDRKRRDDALHFILVGKRTEDHCDYSKRVSKQTERGIG